MTYQNNIKELPRLKDENYENIFKVYQTEDGSYYYNLLQTLHFPENLPDSFFSTYTVEYGDTLPYISYKVYNNIRLWWVITHANNIINPTIKLEPGTVLKIPKTEIVSTILTEIGLQES